MILFVIQYFRQAANKTRWNWPDPPTEKKISLETRHDVLAIHNSGKPHDDIIFRLVSKDETSNDYQQAECTDLPARE